MLNNLKDKVTVLYHGRCNDGMGAAIAIRNSLVTSDTKVRTFEHIFTPVYYGKEDDIQTDSRIIISVDYTPTENFIQEAIGRGIKVLILDHHKTGLEFLIENEHKELDGLYYYIDQSQCGAKLANNFNILDLVLTDMLTVSNSRKHIINNDTVYTNIIHELIIEEPNKSKFFDLLDTRDRWLLDDPQKKADADSLFFYLVHHNWSEMHPEEAIEFYLNVAKTHGDGSTDKALDYMIETGRLIYDVNIKEAEDQVAKAYKFTASDVNHKAINTAVSFNCTKPSDAGNIWCQMSKDIPALFVAVTIGIYDGKPSIGMSVRSNKMASAMNFCVNVNESGYATTGGGHQMASGCRLKIEDYSIEGILKDIVIKCINTTNVAV